MEAYADVVGEISVRAAEVFGRSLPVADIRRTTTGVSDKQAVLKVDIRRTQAIAVAHLVPHPGSWFAKYIISSGRVQCDGDVELREDSGYFLFERCESVLGEILRALCIRVRMKDNASLVGQYHDLISVIESPISRQARTTSTGIVLTLLVLMVQISQPRRHAAIPPFPVGRVVRVSLSGCSGNQCRILLPNRQLKDEHNKVDPNDSLTKSKAAIFLLLTSGSPSSWFVFWGSYLPTRSVASVFPSGARSDHVVWSFGFCEVGVKKLATAFSGGGEEQMRYVSEETIALTEGRPTMRREKCDQLTGNAGLRFALQRWRRDRKIMFGRSSSLRGWRRSAVAGRCRHGRDSQPIRL